MLELKLLVTFIVGWWLGNLLGVSSVKGWGVGIFFSVIMSMIVIGAIAGAALFN